MAINQITHLQINKFRHLEWIDIDIWDKITVISGPNWTGKSSLLWLIGHVFSFRKGKGWLIWKSPIDNKILEAQFSEVFRFSPEKDFLAEYEWKVILADWTEKVASSRYISWENRFRVDVWERQKDEWKIKKPVYYLWLKRLVPLAQENDKDLQFDIERNILQEEISLYEEWYNKILSSNKNIVPQHTKTRNKESYLATTDEYDALWNSSWQDNIAQIILAILTFKRLKEELWDDYNWWLLLIDEIDATLYPKAQLQLMDLFLKTARDYNIQFIFTTHSVEILWYLLEAKRRNFEYSSKIIFLDDSSGSILKLDDESSFKKMRAGLMHSVLEKMKTSWVHLYCEDAEAFIFVKWIIHPSLKKEIKFMEKVSLSCSFYKSLVEQKVPEFLDSIIVLDGDARNSLPKSTKFKIAFLPGDERPENLLYNFLSTLPDNDTFWDKEAGGYTKRVFLANRPSNLASREIMKDWFNREKQYWWKGCRKLLNRWSENNLKIVEKFNERIAGFIRNDY